MTVSAREGIGFSSPICALAVAWMAAGASEGAGVGLGSTGQMSLAVLIVLLSILTVVALIVHTFKRHPLLELAVRISACVAILLTIILVAAGVFVDMAVEDRMSPELAFILVLVTIVFGIAGVIFASLYKSKWIEGPVR